jgi:thioredoxin-dependent peroxiredoxin
MRPIRALKPDLSEKLIERFKAFGTSRAPSARFGSIQRPRLRPAFAPAHNLAYRLSPQGGKCLLNRSGTMARQLKPGEKAPAFMLETDEGKISSAALAGTPYVLYFYPKDDTSGCTSEAIAFSKNAPEFAAIGVNVMGISKDSVQSHEKFRAKHGLTIKLASDSDKKVAMDYGIWGEKKLYGRTFMGVERATFLVDDHGVIRQVWRKVKVPGHAEAVLEAARALVGLGSASSPPVGFLPKSV